MLDLSIVIPIYNTPTTDLQRCFDSMASLSAVSYEVLLIDDGSLPQIGQFCRSYVLEHPTFRYIYKENGGVSSARNLGISHAQGRYLIFADADDLIIGEILETHIPPEDGPDLVLFDILLTQAGTDSVWSAFPLPQGSLDRQEVLYQLFSNSSISGPVAKLYKTQHIRDKGLLFDPDFVSGEDWMFVCDYVLQSNSFVYYPLCSYRYFRQNATGLSRTAKFPDKMLHNQLARFVRKQQIVSSTVWTICKPEQILSLAAIELIENLFNTAADLLLCKQYTANRKKQIRDAVCSADILLTGFTPKKTQIKLQVLTRFPFMLFPLAVIRALYLKRKDRRSNIN